MGVLKKVFGSRDEETQVNATPDVPEVNEAVCPHTALTPHWDNPGDMGKAELATYTCESCGDKFDYAQAERLMNQAPAVLRSTGAAPVPYDAEHGR